MFLLSQNATKYLLPSWSFWLELEGGGVVLRAGQAGACRGCHLFPVLPWARLKAARQSRQRKLRAWGAKPSPASLLGSGTKWPRPGYRASLLQQQSVSIPFLQELPGHPGKEMQRWGPGQGRSSPWRVLTPAGIQGSEGRPERGCTGLPGNQGLSLAFSSSWGQTVLGVSQPLPTH